MSQRRPMVGRPTAASPRTVAARPTFLSSAPRFLLHGAHAHREARRLRPETLHASSPCPAWPACSSLQHPLYTVVKSSCNVRVTFSPSVAPTLVRSSASCFHPPCTHPRKRGSHVRPQRKEGDTCSGKVAGRSSRRGTRTYILSEVSRSLLSLIPSSRPKTAGISRKKKIYVDLEIGPPIF